MLLKVFSNQNESMILSVSRVIIHDVYVSLLTYCIDTTNHDMTYQTKGKAINAPVPGTYA